MNIKRISLLGILCLSLFFIYGWGDKNEEFIDYSLSDDNKKIEDNSSDDGGYDELEQSLSEYRKQREENIKVEKGMLIGRSSKEEDFDDEGLNKPNFDTREMRKAYEAAKKYVIKNLEIIPKTKLTVYECIDPRINAIYGDEDKGVATGYENENIYVCEYDHNGRYQYLILVRDSKEGAWEVIHHGDSYQE